MDKKDQELLSLLLVNARQSTTQLAKRLGMSKETTHHRLKRLQKQVITKFYADIDYKLLGFHRHVCFMQFKNITIAEEKKTLLTLAKHPYITYISSIIGKWNVAFDIIAKDDEHLKKILLKLIKDIGPHLDTYIINSSAVEEATYLHKLFPQPQNNQKITLKNQPQQIDDIDKLILRTLVKNARCPYTELTNTTKMTANGVKQRIIKLKAASIIKGYTIGLNMHTLGLENYVVQIRTLSQDTKKLHQFLKAHPNVFFTYTYLGHQNWDIDIGLFVQKPTDIRNFLLALREHHGEQIKIHELYIIAETIKDNIAPEGLFR